MGRISKMAYPRNVSYHLAGLGAEPDPGAMLPPDVSPTFISEMAKPVDKRRGWVAVPTFDMRQYVQAQLLTFAGGFVVGMGIGAVFGNLLAGKSVSGFGRLMSNPPRRRRRSSRRRRVRRNTARRQSPRRTSTRKRSRGRPTAKPVNEKVLVKMPDDSIVVDVERGFVKLRGRPVGSVYDLGTKFRAIPFEGDVRSFGTLAGAVKHVVRSAEKAA